MQIPPVKRELAIGQGVLGVSLRNEEMALTLALETSFVEANVAKGKRAEGQRS